MKSESRIRRVQLNDNHDDESGLLGIVTSEPDYKLSLTLNKKLNISLRNASPLKLIGNSGDELTYTRYFFESEISGTSFSLISNRSGKSFLLNKLRNIDYILLIQNPENDSYINDILQKMKSSENVTALFLFNLKTLKDKNLHYLTL
jgi:hypothetical protein